MEFNDLKARDLIAVDGNACLVNISNPVKGLETGFLRFGGLVLPEMNNFCGLGAVSADQPGLWFPDERTGVRAHIQHLKAYGSSDDLVCELVDPRFHYVNPRGRASDIYGLAGTWAADTQYGHKLADLLELLYL